MVQGQRGAGQITRIHVTKFAGGMKPLKERSQSRERKKTRFLRGFVLNFFLSNRFFSINLHHYYSSFKDAGPVSFHICNV